MIGFVGRFAMQERMWPPLVMPFHEASKRGPEIPAAQWNVNQSSVFLQGTDEAFDHSNAPVPAHGTKAGLDLRGFAPALEPIAPELTASVGDDVLWLDTAGVNRAIQELLNCPGSWLLSEDHESHGAA